jgi:hypothetical protein
LMGISSLPSFLPFFLLPSLPSFLPPSIPPALPRSFLPTGLTMYLMLGYNLLCSLELMIYQSSPSECWDYRHVPSCLVYMSSFEKFLVVYYTFNRIVWVQLFEFLIYSSY